MMRNNIYKEIYKIENDLLLLLQDKELFKELVNSNENHDELSNSSKVVKLFNFPAISSKRFKFITLASFFNYLENISNSFYERRHENIRRFLFILLMKVSLWLN